MTNPKDCAHKFVKLIERWYGQGKYCVFICNDCDKALMPKFEEFSLEVEKKEVTSDRESSLKKIQQDAVDELQDAVDELQRKVYEPLLTPMISRIEELVEKKKRDE